MGRSKLFPQTWVELSCDLELGMQRLHVMSIARLELREDTGFYKASHAWLESVNPFKHLMDLENDNEVTMRVKQLLETMTPTE